MNEESEKMNVCKNCDTEFIGHYCPQCGQSVSDLDRPFRVLLFDIMANMWAFDTRVFKTIKSLLFKPGEMAADYAEGKRARYMPPFRLYIFVSIIFFLLLNITTTRQLGKEGNLMTISDKDTATVNNSLIDITSNKNMTDEDSNILKTINQNKDYYISRFFSILSWSLFILMPFYAFLLWVLFRKKQKYFLAHFIFAINQHTFLFLIFLIIISVNLIFPVKQVSPESWLILIFPVYVVVGSRRLYKSGWRSTIWRVFSAQFLYMVILLIAIAVIFYLTFMSLFKT